MQALSVIYSVDQADTSQHTVDNSTLDLPTMYDTVNKATHTNWIAAICIALVYIMLLYVFILVIIWYIERRKMIPDMIGKKFSLFNILTLGRGNADDITPGMMFFIVIVSVLVMLSIIGGFYFDILIKILANILAFIRGLFNV